MTESPENIDREASMRASKAPTPKSADELAAYIESLRAQEHCYGSCVYAMSLAATATFNYMASQLGVTGFQASCADMDILKRTRGMDHGFLILNARDLLYPQYDLQSKAIEWIAKTEPKLAKAAADLLAKSGATAHPNVVKRWREIAALSPAPTTEDTANG